MAKSIIEKRIYDTDTAKEIANWDNGLSYSDFNNIEETLYKTQKGQFFLYGKGGANTAYAESNGNMSYGSSSIVLMTNQEAYEWLEMHDFVKVIEELFSSEIEEG